MIVYSSIIKYILLDGTLEYISSNRKKLRRLEHGLSEQHAPNRSSTHLRSVESLSCTPSFSRLREVILRASGPSESFEGLSSRDHVLH